MRFSLVALWLTFLPAATGAQADEVSQQQNANVRPKVSDTSSGGDGGAPVRTIEAVDAVLQRVRNHSFQPIKNGFTVDAEIQKQGIADFNNTDWHVRLLAARDLVRLGLPAFGALVGHLQDENEHVRQVSAMVLGVLQAKASVPALQDVLRSDKDSVVRSQAAITIGELGDPDAVSLLKDRAQTDPSRDVRHQCEIAAYRIERKAAPSDEVARAFATLDESSFRELQIGKPAIDFELFDTRGRKWRLADNKGKTVVVVWIFADWCPVCHGEFHELMEQREKFTQQNIELVTIECHDLFRARVMVGDELSPQYWFSKQSPQDSYRDKIWWRHLSDPAGTVGAKYGVDPMAFVVHSEWINRPSTIIIDPAGIVRFAYYGTYWGDRPSIAQTLDMITTGRYEFRHPKRLEVSKP